MLALLALIVVLAIGLLCVLQGLLPESVLNLVGTLTGVFVAVSLEAWLNRRKEKKEAAQAVEMVRGEPESNLFVAQRVRDEEKDLNAVVMSLLSLREEFWTAVSRGGRIAVIEDLERLRDVAGAYDYVRALRLVSELFFRGDETIRLEGKPGFTPEFDLLRKELAAATAKAVEGALKSLGEPAEGAEGSTPR